MDLSYWSRIKAQRYNARQIHAGTYKPSPIGAKARKVAIEIESKRSIPPVPPPSPPKSIGFDYWGSDRYRLIQQVQAIKTREIFDRGKTPSINSDRFVERNPITGKEVPKEDLIYAATHMQELMASGAIRENRWAFLWYN